jgi:small conductance mechanosensitive channel
MLVVVMVLVVALNKLGISITPFVAAIGAASLGAGLALQGLLSNYASGFNIILLRPFVVGDTISVKGVTGVVTEVLLGYTIIRDEDNVKITIPNKHIVGEILHNSRQVSLLELTVGINYSHNPIEVAALIQTLVEKQDYVDHEKPPLVGIDEFGDSSINIGIRFWTPTARLYESKFTTYRLVYELLQQEKIKIPFPQREIKILNHSEPEH